MFNRLPLTEILLVAVFAAVIVIVGHTEMVQAALGDFALSMNDSSWHLRANEVSE